MANVTVTRVFGICLWVPLTGLGTFTSGLTEKSSYPSF